VTGLAFSGSGFALRHSARSLSRSSPPCCSGASTSNLNRAGNCSRHHRPGRQTGPPRRNVVLLPPPSPIISASSSPSRFGASSHHPPTRSTPTSLGRRPSSADPPLFFSAGRAIFEDTVFPPVSRDRPIDYLCSPALTQAMLHVPPLIVSLPATAILTAIAFADAALSRDAHPAAVSAWQIMLPACGR